MKFLIKEVFNVFSLSTRKYKRIEKPRFPTGHKYVPLHVVQNMSKKQSEIG
jgi:hypothetical protein